MQKKNTYTTAGLALLIAGGLVLLSGIFIFATTWISAFGISMLILSFILLALGRTVPSLSPEAARLLLQTGTDNIGAVIEELGIQSKAVYLPSSLTNGRPQALIPLHINPSLPKIKQPLPNRLIVRYGTAPDDIGLLLTTVGSAAVSLLAAKPGASAEALETALTSLLSGTLDVASSARVSSTGNSVRIEIDKPRLESSITRDQRCLGGPLASVAASVTAEALGRPVTIKYELNQKDKYILGLEVIE